MSRSGARSRLPREGRDRPPFFGSSSLASPLPGPAGAEPGALAARPPRQVSALQVSPGGSRDPRSNSEEAKTLGKLHFEFKNSWPAKKLAKGAGSLCVLRHEALPVPRMLPAAGHGGQRVQGGLDPTAESSLLVFQGGMAQGWPAYQGKMQG